MKHPQRLQNIMQKCTVNCIKKHKCVSVKHVVQYRSNKAYEITIQQGAIGGHQNAFPCICIFENIRSLPDRRVASHDIDTTPTSNLATNNLIAERYLAITRLTQLFATLSELIPCLMLSLFMTWRMCAPLLKPSPCDAILAMRSLKRRHTRFIRWRPLWSGTTNASDDVRSFHFPWSNSIASHNRTSNMSDLAAGWLSPSSQYKKDVSLQLECNVAFVIPSCCEASFLKAYSASAIQTL